MPINLEQQALLKLLQLASPALPVGAFSYSEGLETLTHQGKLKTVEALEHWLRQELRYGAVRLEGAIAIRIHRSYPEPERLAHWNHWLSATRETQELRQQSWQMGRALTRLLVSLHPELQAPLKDCGTPGNFAVAFAIAAVHWHIPEESMILGYLQSWATNLVNAAVKLVPLGQTEGQRLLLKLYPEIADTAAGLQILPEEQLTTSSWGAGLASIHHETLYSRLFRS